jgi:8-oxo-dGTP diphosphatase
MSLWFKQKIQTMSRQAGLKIVHVVAGILLRHDRMLIAERPVGKPYNGFWEFPGGKIEKNETGAVALARELQEELGIHVITAEHLFDHSYTYPDKQVLLQIWLVREFSGEPTGQENQALKWVTMTEMHSMPLLEGNWPILERVKDLV